MQIKKHVKLQNLGSVRRMGLDTKSNARPAGGLESRAGMMERLAATATPEGNNMLLPSGWKTLTMRCGSTASWSMAEKRRNFQ